MSSLSGLKHGIQIGKYGVPSNSSILKTIKILMEQRSLIQQTLLLDMIQDSWFQNLIVLSSKVNNTE